MEFQAVVMAAGRGSRMTDLVSNTPKALLPVANIPMVWYPVNMLEKAGFPEAIIVVLEGQKSAIKQSLQEICGVKMQLDFVSIPDDEDWGTADSLRFLADKLTKDFLMVSCDLITDIQLHLLADVHRTNDATVTMLLSPTPDISEMSVPGGKANKKIDRDFVGLDEKGDRVLFMSPEADLEESIQFRKSFFKRHPYINIRTKLVDSHLYLMKREVLDFLAVQEKLTAFKGEVIPSLVKKQCSNRQLSPQNQQLDATTKLNLNHSKNDTSASDDKSEDEFSQLIKEMSTWSHKEETDSIKCYSYTMESGFCLRANSLITYCEANRQVPRQLQNLCPDGNVPLVHPAAVISEKTQTGADSMVGEGTKVGDRCGVKRSVLGKHCVIKDKVKISNSVIMDHVTIEEGSVVSGCIVCNNAHLQEKCDLKDCLIGDSQNVLALGKFTNEVLVEREKMMEI